MRKSIIDARRERLEAAGKWKLFHTYRDELKGEGKSPLEANEIAAAKYDTGLDMPKSAKPKKPKAARGKKPAPKVRASSQDAAEIVWWLYNHIGVPDVTVEQAPSPGAYAHLQILNSSAAAKQNFFQFTWAKLLPNQTELKSSTAKTDDGRAVLEIIEQVAKATQEAEKMDWSQIVKETVAAKKPDGNDDAADW